MSTSGPRRDLRFGPLFQQSLIERPDHDIGPKREENSENVLFVNATFKVTS